MTSYTPPASTDVDFNSRQYTPNQFDSVDFTFIERAIEETDVELVLDAIATEATQSFESTSVDIAFSPELSDLVGVTETTNTSLLLDVDDITVPLRTSVSTDLTLEPAVSETPRLDRSFETAYKPPNSDDVDFILWEYTVLDSANVDFDFETRTRFETLTVGVELLPTAIEQTPEIRESTAVEIVFDPEVTEYEDLQRIFGIERGNAQQDTVVRGNAQDDFIVRGDAEKTIIVFGNAEID